MPYATYFLLTKINQDPTTADKPKQPIDQQTNDPQAEPQSELLMGLEPMTSSLPRKCSTTELQQQKPQTEGRDRPA